MPRSLLRFATALLLVLPIRGWAGSAEEDWAKVTALDAGPKSTQGDARGVAAAHLDRQENALRSFLSEHGGDAHAFEAGIRLARLLQIRGGIEGSRKAFEDAAHILDSLAKSATPEQRVEVDFARVTFLMRTLSPGSTQGRDRLLAAARNFQHAHPDDRRVAPLLAEVSSLFLLQPQTMRALLDDADTLATETHLRGRIADDLRRIDLLGQPVTLNSQTTDGKPFDLEDAHGSIVALVFFAAWSPLSVSTLETMKRATAPFKDVRLIGVSLDSELPPLTAALREKGIADSVVYDGKSWESPAIRTLGINSLPTVWLLDRKGRLRSLDGTQSTASQLRQLVGER